MLSNLFLKFFKLELYEVQEKVNVLEYKIYIMDSGLRLGGRIFSNILAF